MAEFNGLNVLAGLVAYGVAVLIGAGPMVYLVFRFNIQMTRRTNEEALLRAGHRAVAIELGAKILCQAILIRHAVFATMAVLRSLFVDEFTHGETFGVIGRSLLFIAIIAGLALISLEVADRTFARLTRNLQEKKEIREKDNVAMALFAAFVLLAITMILNEGMQDLSRSLIPFGRSGLVSLP